MRSKLEPEMWPCDTGQWIPCFYRCDLIITGMSNDVKGRYKIKPRLIVCQPFSMSIATTLHDSILSCIMYPQAILLATITKRKTEGFPFLYHTCMSTGLYYLLCYWQFCYFPWSCVILHFIPNDMLTQCTSDGLFKHFFRRLISTWWNRCLVYNWRIPCSKAEKRGQQKHRSKFIFILI